MDGGEYAQLRMDDDVLGRVGFFEWCRHSYVMGRAFYSLMRSAAEDRRAHVRRAKRGDPLAEAGLVAAGERSEPARDVQKN